MLGTALAFARHGHAVLPLTWPIDVNGRLGVAAGRRPTAFRRRTSVRPAGAERAAYRLDR